MEDDATPQNIPKGKDKILVISLLILWIAVLLIIIIVSINAAGPPPPKPPEKKPRPILDVCCKKKTENEAIDCFYDAIAKNDSTTTEKPSNLTTTPTNATDESEESEGPTEEAPALRGMDFAHTFAPKRPFKIPAETKEVLTSPRTTTEEVVFKETTTEEARRDNLADFY